jgi:hypothetical protein
VSTIIEIADLILTEDSTDQDWIAVGMRLGRAERSRQWLIGDWVNWKLGRRVPSGQHHSEYQRKVIRDASEITGMHGKTLRMFSSICHSWPVAERREGVFWGHHYALMALRGEDRTRFLDMAEQEGLTLKELRRRLREELPPHHRAGRKPGSRNARPTPTHPASLTGGRAYGIHLARALAQAQTLNEALWSTPKTSQEAALQSALRLLGGLVLGEADAMKRAEKMGLLPAWVDAR